MKQNMEEQAQYLMWLRRREILRSSSAMINPDSWEEKAFAEDFAGGPHGTAYIWPPRSYTCSFCKREFRSAQALGGHMNVHRRDKARLKQSLIQTTSDNNQNPNSTPKTNVVVESSNHPPSIIRVSKNLPENIIYPTKNRHEDYSTCARRGDDDEEDEDEDEERVETGLYVGLSNSLYLSGTVGSSGDEDMMIGCKRAKTRDFSKLMAPFVFLRNEKHGFQFGQLEELDLELRLGVAVPSKVK